VRIETCHRRPRDIAHRRHRQGRLGVHASHRRDGFSRGVDILDTYFKRHATQDVRRRARAWFVAVEISTVR
jgi:hypothetical protein